MLKKRKVVALLPMKANSERVKGKNFRLLAGKPLFQWILDALLSIDLIEIVVIKKDEKSNLLEKGLKESSRVVIRERKGELCGDFVSMNLILADDIASVPADTYLMTHTTNPFIAPHSIAKALSQYWENLDKYDSLFSVNKVQTRFYREDMTAINHQPGNLIRTQDLEPWYEENSCLFLFSESSFAETNARIGKRPQMFITPALESIDIDEPEDWEIAAALAERIVAKGRNQ